MIPPDISSYPLRAFRSDSRALCPGVKEPRVRIGIPREIHPTEKRSAATPGIVVRLGRLGFDVVVERGTGAGMEWDDSAYASAGAALSDAAGVWAESDIILKVRAPEMHPELGVHEADLMQPGALLIGFLRPAQNQEMLEKLAKAGASAIAMDCIPRTTRAQRMDALSAMANLVGYRAVIEAAHHFPKFFSGQVTAADTILPAKVLVVGAGVAGLAAIGAARGLGAIVKAFDTRPEVAEQVRSMGAEFLELDFKEEGSGGGGYAKEMSKAFIEAEMALFAQQAMEVDIIITTALIPGRRAPVLFTEGMVESMKEGSVIVDLAAEQGGNCAVTRPGEVVKRFGVTVIGLTDLLSRMARQSSHLYGATIVHLLEEMGGGDGLQIDLENDIVRPALVTHEGKVTWPPPQTEQQRKEEPQAQTDAVLADDSVPVESVAKTTPSKKILRRWRSLSWAAAAAAVALLIGTKAPESFQSHLTVFVLACFVGWQVVWNVTPALHTPLMSVTNAISGIIIIGGMLQLSSGPSVGAATILGVVAIFVATINIAGGFLVTNRMLSMFRT
ncbi:MAG: Re/Si-specific NAD(P)(+) transhydrogenase subunit alpha [Planctomycetes bacterium]|nr:Re/Si-specific NAD(P)(+) transhydrogenase subunit alpha [Planctomycetota bacterium]